MTIALSSGYFNGPSSGVDADGNPLPYDFTAIGNWYVNGLSSTGYPGVGDTAQLGISSTNTGYEVGVFSGENVTIGQLSFTYANTAPAIAFDQDTVLEVVGDGAAGSASLRLTGATALAGNTKADAYVTLSQGGALEVDGSAARTASVVFGGYTNSYNNADAGTTTAFGADGDADTLTIAKTASFAAPIYGLTGSDRIVLSSVAYSAGDKYTWSAAGYTPLAGGSHDVLNQTFGTPGVLTITSATGATLGVLDVATPTDHADTPNTAFALVDAGGKLAIMDSPPCFLPGTRILTDAGEVAVEALTLGHRVVTHDGSLRPITWIGRSHMDATTHAAPLEACPVRIRAGAFAEGMPRRDLLVTPEHCVFVDGHLIPARMLVNGATIVVEAAITAYEYFHIECAAHCILVSEGLPSESYHDDGNRGLFAAALGAVRAIPGPLAAPLGVARAVAEPVWRRLHARARQLGFADQLGAADRARRAAAAAAAAGAGDGWRLVDAAGHALRPIERTRNRHTFAVPAGAGGLRLVSGTARPADTVGPFVDDRRPLGVLVGEVAVWRNRERVVVNPHLQATALPGWFGREGGGHRWTAGDAALPWAAADEGSLLEIEVMAGSHLAATATPAAVRQAA